MEIREQVFVSSTYLDLVEEREVVIQGLLEAECFPAGMEMFPASNEDKWELIKGVIDDSDYYLLIIGGRYGSTDPVDQVSYTEKEYDYASSTGKPIIPFLHGDPGSIPRRSSENDPQLQEKLTAFRKRVEDEKTVKYWQTSAELAGQVAQALMNLRRKFPAVGWVRGDHAMTPETRAEIATLKARVAELELLDQTEVPIYPDLSEGDDTVDYTMRFRYWTGNKWATQDWEAETAWDDFFINVAPALLHEIPEDELTNLTEETAISFGKSNRPARPSNYVGDPSFHTRTPIADDVRIQFLALRLIERGTKKRVPSDKGNYWKLTRRGEDRLMSLRAIRKKSADATS